MTRHKLLDAAIAKTCVNREDSFNTIASLWTTYLGLPITPKDVCMMMILLKVARISLSYAEEDSLVDIAGYAACADEYLEDEPFDPLTDAQKAYDLVNGVQYEAH